MWHITIATHFTTITARALLPSSQHRRSCPFVAVAVLPGIASVEVSHSTTTVEPCLGLVFLLEVGKKGGKTAE